MVLLILRRSLDVVCALAEAISTSLFKDITMFFQTVPTSFNAVFFRQLSHLFTQ